MAVSLSDVPLFAGLDEAAYVEIERRMTQREFAPQATILREGSSGAEAFLILAGTVSIRRRDPDTGIEFELAQLGAGQMIGEMALIAGRPRNASVIAIETTTCAVISRTFSTISTRRCSPVGPAMTVRREAVIAFTSLAMSDTCVVTSSIEAGCEPRRTMF